MQKTNGDIAPQSIDALAALKDERAVLPLILETQNIFHKEAARKALIQMGPLVETALDNIVIDVKATPECASKPVNCLQVPPSASARRKEARVDGRVEGRQRRRQEDPAAALAVLKRRS